MTVNEIRKKPLELVKKIAHASREDQVTSIISCACYEMFVEIAAQLSELNENIKLLAPEEEVPESPEESYEHIYVADTEQIDEEKRKLAELLAQPVSDPEKFVRCSDCAKEIERPSWLEVGKNTIICDSCIPF
jgi:hypothetical protein